ncbi:MAG: HAMP domain-containing histidine kinase [Bacteroidales bacterium]|jgi:signal transduction histidine kinase|nr:HAMP domain-containing histidine kinase [Bacteroidales bacterium]
MMALFHNIVYSKYVIVILLGMLLACILFLVIKLRRYRKVKSVQLQLLQQIETYEDEIERLSREFAGKTEAVERILQENSAFEKGNLVKDKLLSVISHDLRSPVASLQVCLTLFNANSLPQKDLSDFIGKLLSRVENTTTMLANLLHWSQSQLNGIEPVFNRAPVQEVIENSIRFYRMQAEQKHITIHNASTLSADVIADVEMLKIVLRNLISNALKFTLEQGTITLNAIRQNKEVIVSVKDTGVGICPENQEKLFANTHFTTLGTGKEKGTGLGLTLCKDFVEHNHGKLWLESKEGEGTCFYFTVPLAEEMTN